MDDTELMKLAEKELLGEAKKASARHSIVGPSGWQPCPLLKTNKRFLANTLLQTISSNRTVTRKQEKRSKEYGGDVKGQTKISKRKFLQITPTKVENFIYKKPKIQDEKTVQKNKVYSKNTEMQHRSSSGKKKVKYKTEKTSKNLK